MLKGPDGSKAGSSSICLLPRPHTFPICTGFSLALNLIPLCSFLTYLHVRYNITYIALKIKSAFIQIHKWNHITIKLYIFQRYVFCKKHINLWNVLMEPVIFMIAKFMQNYNNSATIVLICMYSCSNHLKHNEKATYLSL